MSWSFKIAARSKTGALNAVAKHAANPHGLATSVAAAITERIEALPEGPVFVESNGHLDGNGGNATFSVNGYIEIAE